MKSIKNKLKLVIIWVMVILSLDFIFGLAIIELMDSKEKKIISHPFFHHSLEKNINEKQDSQFSTVKICTNKYGFKVSCENVHNETTHDIIFIGDSFTEGVGLSYEESFVGIIDKTLKDVKIANLGVSSYSPSIYLSKINYFINKGFKFKEVVVYIDISDMQDEAINYQLSNDLEVETLEFLKIPKTKKIVKKFFPINYKILSYFKNYFFPKMNNANNQRYDWTYNLNSDGYGELGVKGSIEKSVLIMDQLYELLLSNNIKMSIGVYPWPGQLKFDSVNSIQVEIWKKFSINRNLKIYNSFPSFHKLIQEKGVDKVLDSYYTKGDIHFNKKGAQIIAKDYLNYVK